MSEEEGELARRVRELEEREKSSTRRGFLKLAACGSGAVALTGLAVAAILQDLEVPHYESILKAKEALANPPMFGRTKPYMISGRIKTLEPKNPSSKDRIHLVLTDRKYDLRFNFSERSIGYLFKGDDDEMHRLVAERVMRQLRETRRNDEVLVVVQPFSYCKKNDWCVRIADYENKSYNKRRAEKRRLELTKPKRNG